MDLKEFRILHSELIEHYQFIEYHLECIYAAFQEGESFVDNLKIVDKDSILNLVERILLLQKKTKRIVLSEEVCKKYE